MGNTLVKLILSPKKNISPLLWRYTRLGEEANLEAVVT